MTRPDPFEIPGLTFTPVSFNLAKARLAGAALLLLPLFAGALALLIMVSRPLGGTVLAVTLLLALWLLWLIPRQVRAIGYAEADDDLVIRKGIMFRSLRIVPYGRMQFVDVQQGPVDRWLGISEVKLFTASASTDATLPGLPSEEAGRLRDRLTARGEARLAGL